MKVCIVTMHKAQNCGAYMQSYALGEKIKELGHEVVYLYQPFSVPLLIKTLYTAVMEFDLKQVSLILRYLPNALRDVRHFKEVRDVQDVDRFVLGSDIIWNIHSKYIQKNFNRYFGVSFPGEKVFSYAPCCANSDPELFRREKRIAPALTRMRDISVRDTHSLDIISEASNRPVELVCDPVLLHDAAFYRKAQRPCPHKDFILVYAFHAFRQGFCGEKRIQEIKEFAKKHNKKLISFGQNYSWCDLCVPYDYFGMNAYFEAADYVITNTFHGSIFAILNHKKFVEFSRKKLKVVQLMEQLGLYDRVLQPEAPVAEILERELDHEALDARLHALRESSTAYLRRNLQ